MKRVMLLIVTNFAILAVLSVTMSLLGIDRVSLWRKLRRYEEQGLIEADETDGALRVRDVSA